MLVLSRKKEESIIIDGKIEVKIIRVDGDTVKVGIQAPADVPIHRREIYQQIQESNRESVVADRSRIPKLLPHKNEAVPAESA
ncbi:MAG: carbon storage regulator CsrA [Verrucomicrobiia bacterium]|jgi:carbon storage regulator